MLVQKLRLQRGWSQQQLAELSGLSTRTIQRIENGQAASMETLKSLAAVFDVDFAILQPETTMNDTTPATTARTLALDEELALAHVRKVQRFYAHALRYAILVPVMLALNYFLTPARFWSLWVALGWGLGLAFQGARVFELLPFWRGDWERRQVEKRLGRSL